MSKNREGRPKKGCKTPRQPDGPEGGKSGKTRKEAASTEEVRPRRLPAGAKRGAKTDRRWGRTAHPVTEQWARRGHAASSPRTAETPLHPLAELLTRYGVRELIGIAGAVQEIERALSGASELDAPAVLEGVTNAVTPVSAPNSGTPESAACDAAPRARAPEARGGTPDETDRRGAGGAVSSPTLRASTNDARGAGPSSAEGGDDV